MNTGLWFGDHESDNFFPASLLKLPIAIAVYKQIESEPSFQKKQLLYTQDLASINSAKQLNAESTLVVGQSYPVDLLVEKMLTISDNGAKNLLLSALDKSYLDQLLKIVNFADPDAPQSYEVSSRKYANFLRVLYGSSYINEEHSEFVLELLAKSEFRDGLVAGLPRNVQIAHKFGVYEFEEEIKGKNMLTVQLHDCGVVYHPSKPFIICFMTKGKDDPTLFRIISHVSKMVYEYQDIHDREGY
jgi:beta-lactamase class A